MLLFGKGILTQQLGHLGVANFFLKAGLRGTGLYESVLSSMTVELTSAKHASN